MQFGAGPFQFSEKSYPGVSATIQRGSSGKVILGLPQWRVPEWCGDFYAPSTSPTRMLDEYAQRLDCVEVSSSFYSPVQAKTYEKWRDQVSEDFRFLPKWPQSITHESALDQCEDLSRQFVESVRHLGEKLGVTILQLPPQFSTGRKAELFHFLEAWGTAVPLAVEFRHPSWFEENFVYHKLASYLRERGIGMVCSDTARRRDIFHLSFTGKINVVRYLSDGQRETDKKRMAWWKEKLREAAEDQIFYFILHQPDNASTPTLIRCFDPEKAQHIQSLNADPQASLF